MIDGRALFEEFGRLNPEFVKVGKNLSASDFKAVDDRTIIGFSRLRDNFKVLRTNKAFKFNEAIFCDSVNRKFSKDGEFNFKLYSDTKRFLDKAYEKYLKLLDDYELIDGGLLDIYDHPELYHMLKKSKKEDGGQFFYLSKVDNSPIFLCKSNIKLKKHEHLNFELYKNKDSDVMIYKFIIENTVGTITIYQKVFNLKRKG